MAGFRRTCPASLPRRTGSHREVKFTCRACLSQRCKEGPIQSMRNVSLHLLTATNATAGSKLVRKPPSDATICAHPIGYQEKEEEEDRTMENLTAVLDGENFGGT